MLGRRIVFKSPSDPSAASFQDPSTEWLPFYPVQHLTAAASHVFVSKFVMA